MLLAILRNSCYFEEQKQVVLAKNFDNFFYDRDGQQLFASNPSDFYIATSAVTSDEAAEQTQGKQARRLGKKLWV